MYTRSVAPDVPVPESRYTMRAPSAGAERLYIGTYTWYSSRGIYRSGLDLGTGALSPTNLAGTATSPSFLALHPNRKFLYAVNEDGAKVVVRANACTVLVPANCQLLIA